MEKRFISSQSVLIAFLFLYWIPVLFLVLFASIHIQWWLILMTLGVSSAGLIGLLTLFRHWEIEISKTIAEALPVVATLPEIKGITPAPEIDELKNSLAESKKLEEIANQQLQEKIVELSLLQKERRDERHEVDSLKQQLSQLKILYNDLKTQHQSCLNENERACLESQEKIESQKKLIDELECKVRELNYEIKTILKVAQESSR